MTWTLLLPMFLFVMVAGGCLGVGAGEYYHRSKDLDRTGALLWGGLAVIYLGCAVTFLVGAEPVLSALLGSASAYCAYRAWLFWRRRKDRKPSRVLGVVKNLGHRLTVVPVPGGAR